MYGWMKGIVHDGIDDLYPEIELRDTKPGFQNIVIAAGVGA